MFISKTFHLSCNILFFQCYMVKGLGGLKIIKLSRKTSSVASIYIVYYI